jgi:hypothetical protein
MSEHISEELPRLLTGDADRDVVMAAGAHLRVCPDCQQELVSAVIAHASLTSAHRFAPEIMAPAPDALPVGRDADEHGADEPQPTPLPDMSSLFAQARADAAATAQAPARHHRRRLIGIAAAAAVVVGGGVTGGLLATSGPSTPSAQTVQLAAYGSAAHPGKTADVTIAGSRLRVDATKLPRLDAQHIYELWVTDAQRTKMQAVGTIGNDNRAELTLPTNVISKYSDFEVSVQPTSQLNRYSGTSVLRGDYK